MKTGIVVEGGGMRGIYAAGVLDVFLEENIHVDGVIGVSAGAIHGCSFVAEQKGRSLRYNLKYCRDPRYMSLRSWIKNGDIFDTGFCYRELPERLDPFDNDAFEASPTEFYVTCTDVDTGKPVYHQCPSLRGDKIDWVRASASMPLASRIVEIDGQKLMDGGVGDSIPVGAFRKMGFQKNVVILTRPEGYRKKPNSLMPLMRKVFREHPEFLETARWRHLAYNRELDEIRRQQEAGEILVIRPSRTIKIQRTERSPQKIRRMYELGRQDGQRMANEVREFLGLA
ncbi:MAG: patatin family protein [Clostridium sp.]|nr:patatin family protein [Clostridium sp.]